MPRNDQITRQWHLLRRLEGSHGLALDELVESVPDDFPKNARTVRRDLEALEAVGFPLVTEHRNGQTRWRLMEGFRDIPALGFSATELMALLLSRNLLKPLEGTEIQASLNSALSKASAALPPQGHEYVRSVEQMFSIGLGPHKKYSSGIPGNRPRRGSDFPGQRSRHSSAHPASHRAGDRASHRISRRTSTPLLSIPAQGQRDPENSWSSSPRKLPEQLPKAYVGEGLAGANHSGQAEKPHAAVQDDRDGSRSHRAGGRIAF